MNGIATHLLSNVNLFLGDKTTLGQVKELKIPTLKWAMKDHEALGMVGKIKLPLGIEALEGDLTFNSYYPEAMKKMGNGKKFHSLIAMGSLERFDSSGLIEEMPLVVTMNAHFSEVPFGNFKQQDNVDWATKLTVYAIEQKINGESILKFNALANIYEVAGEDILTKYRTNLGG